jgi:hypothetical protein
VPNYVAPHVVPLVCLWFGGHVLQSVLLILRNVDPAAALGVNLLGWGLIGAMSLVILLLQKIPKLLPLAMILIAIISAGIFPIIASLVQWNRSSIDWYLRGHEPARATIFIASGVIASVAMLRQSFRMHSTLLERGISSPPLGFDPSAMSSWQNNVYWKLKSQNTDPSWHWRLFNRRLESAIHQSSCLDWRHRSNLWIAGNPASGNIVPLTAAGAMLACSLVLLLMFEARFSPGTSLARGPLTLVFAIVISDFPLFPLGATWRSRRTTFGVESLRSMSRRDFARQVAQAIAWDLVPLATVYLAILAWFIAFADPNRWSWGWTVGMLMVFVARWIAAYGMVLWGITIRRDWVMILVTTVAGYSLIFTNFVIIFLQAPVLNFQALPPDMPQIGAGLLAVMASAFVLVAGLIAGSAYQRWKQIELV